MSDQRLSPGHRAALFRQLALQGTGAGQWDRMFRLLEQGQDAARRAHLDELAAQFRDGRTQLLGALRDCGQFLAWELEFIGLGLATAQLTAIYTRLAEHYEQMQAFAASLRAHALLPLGLVLATGLILPVAAYLNGQLGAGVALLLAALPLLLCGLLWWAAQALLPLALAGRLAPRWMAPRWVALAYRMPGVGDAMAAAQTYHYFANLSLCLESGTGLAQALRQAAEPLPASPCRRRFEAVEAAVAGGGRLSEALRDSGLLRGLALQPVARGAGALDAQRALAAAARVAYLEKLEFWGRWLPQGGLVLVPLLLALNLLAMGAVGGAA